MQRIPWIGLCLSASTALAAPALPPPLHLDDIHFMVSNEARTVELLQSNFDACEMAHPDRPIEYVRYLSVRYQDPTLTITGPTPATESDELRARTTGHVDIIPAQRNGSAHFGVYWVALSTRSLTTALEQLRTDGLSIAESSLTLPHEPTAAAALAWGPDNIRMAVVERPSEPSSLFGIDHLLLLVADVGANVRFFRQLFAASVQKQESGLAVLRVADAVLVVVEPERLGLRRSEIGPVQNIPWAAGGERQHQRVSVQASVEHLGFLYANVPQMAKAAAEHGYAAEYPPFRYSYRGRPTPFTVTEFLSPDGFGIEAVSADGRTGPHAYYLKPCPSHS